ncbi:hypothetical protein HIV73_001821 [Campylobacter coli]|nr:hypothetical protein [Campylobacter coli]EFK9719944.1 hypothetical protein [Campylobacter coli]
MHNLDYLSLEYEKLSYMFSYIFTDFYRVKIEIKLSKISKNILRLKLSSLSCVQVVGERSICVEGIPVRSAGANRSEHAGMSSDN